MATFYIDPDSGNDASAGTSFALAWKTVVLGATAARIAPGDTIRIKASPIPTSLGMTATWTDNSATVTLNSALNATVHLCEANWTGVSADVTQATTSTCKQGSNALTFTVGAAFGTGLAAYSTLASTDFSGYQQLSFWIKSNAATKAASDISIKLCSDTIGTAVIDTFNVPAMSVANVFHCFTVDKGSAMGAAIQSVALYINTDVGAETVTLDCIVACKAASAADSLSLTSLIGKNSVSDGWYGIAGISGATITLDMFASAVPSGYRGYSGTSEVVTTYKRETFKTVVATSNSILVNQIMDAGTAALGHITFSGGWDRTDMSTQLTGESKASWFCGTSSIGTGWDSGTTPAHFSSTENIFLHRYNAGFVGNGNPNQLRFINCGASNIGGNLMSTSSFGGYIDGFYGFNSNGGFFLGNGSSKFYAKDVVVNNSVATSGGIAFQAGQVYCQNLKAMNNSAYGLGFLSGVSAVIMGLVTRLNTTAGFAHGGNTSYIKDWNCADTTEGFFTTGIDYAEVFLHSQNHDITANNHKMFANGGNIITAVDQLHGTSTLSWKFSPTSATLVDTYRRLRLPIAQVLCKANVAVTISGYFRRTNTGLTGGLRIKGAQLAGMTAADYTSAITVAADTWEQLSITFTPTETGVVEVLAECYGGSTYNMWVCDLAFS